MKNVIVDMRKYLERRKEVIERNLLAVDRWEKRKGRVHTMRWIWEKRLAEVKERLGR